MDDIKVLILEKYEGSGEDLVQMLRENVKISCDVVAYSDLIAGLAAVRQTHFDVALLCLPELDGEMIFQQVLKGLENIPLIVLTETEDEELGLQMVQQGAQDYLSKQELSIYLLRRAISYAVERHRMNHQLMSTSMLDDLTRLHNRRGFTTLAEQQLKLAARAKHKLLFMFIDLDGLKGINDVLGHQNGDRALQETGKILTKTFRDSDVVGRIGGDEFAVLVVESGKSEFVRIQNRLGDNIHELNASGMFAFTISLSIGIAEWDPYAPKPFDALMREADEMMYVQKRLKRQLFSKGDEPSTLFITEDEESSTLLEEETIRSILLIEDNPGDARLIEVYLEMMDEPYEIVHALRLADAINVLKSRNFTLVFLDLNLPDSTGLESVEKLVATYRDTPVLVMTGYNNEDVAKQALQLGAQDYLVKGEFDESVLRRAIQYAIERQDLRRDNLRIMSEIRESEARFRKIVEENADGILLIDNQYRVQMRNQKAVKLLARCTKQGPEEILKNIRLGTSEPQLLTISNEDESDLFLEVRQSDVFWQGEIAYLVTLQDVTSREFARQALFASEERLKNFFDNVALGMYRIDLTGVFKFANPAFLEMLGYQAFYELEKTNYYDLFANSEDAEIRKQALLKDKVVKGDNVAWKTVDGNTIFVSETLQASRKNGDTFILEGTADDVTKTVRSKAQQRLQSHALNAAANAIVITDPSGYITWANPAFTTLTGYSLEDVLGKNTRIFKSGIQDDSYYVSFWKTIAKKEIWKGEIVNKRKDGSLYSEEMTVTPLVSETGEITHYIAIKQDITERKKSEEQIRSRLRELEVLNAVSFAVVEAQDENMLIARVTQLLQKNLFFENIGVLLLSTTGDTLTMHPSYHGVSPGMWLGTISISSGIVGDVIKTMIPKRVRDKNSSSNIMPLLQDAQSALCVPLIVEGRMLGVINAQSKNVGAFTSNHERFLVIIAGQMATAIQQFRFRDAEQKQRHMAEALRDSAMALNSSLSFELIYDSILEIIFRLIPYDSAALMLNENKMTRVIRSRRLHNAENTETKEAVVLSLRDHQPFFIMQETRQPVLISDVKLSDLWTPLERTQWVNSYLGAPIVKNKEVLGFINLNHRKANHFNKGHAKALATLTNQLAVALENARLYQNLHRQLSFMESVHSIDLAITGSMDKSFTFEVISSHVRNQLEVDAVNILLMDPDLLVLESVASNGFVAPDQLRHRLRLAEGLPGYVCQTYSNLHIPNLQNTEHNVERLDMIEQEGFISYYAAPLLVKGEVRGVLEVFCCAPFAIDDDIENFVSTVATQTAIAVDNAALVERLELSNRNISIAYDTTLEGWANALELRDYETSGHSRRVVDMTVSLASHIGVPKEKIIHLRRGAILHDIGKMAISDQILLKPASLDPEEWEQMRKHPLIAYNLLKPIQFLKQALEIPLYHHEKWDGSGYPRGLQGKQIPLAARIFSVVDVWDAITNSRPYRRAWDKNEAREYIKSQSGRHFDPSVVFAFLQMLAEQDEFFAKGQD